MPFRVLRISSGIWFVWHKLRAMMSYCGKFATILGAETLIEIIMPKLKQVVQEYKTWNEVMLWLTQMMCCVYSITYKANEWCGGKSNRHFLRIRACMKWIRTLTKRKRSKRKDRKHYLKLLASGFQNNLLVCFNKLRSKTLATTHWISKQILVEDY